ncbi:MAG: hypothetical protein IPM24_00865 [Bryobacterales bacterium]|nr:hypothetical protein [Bryobacterales bacterium]
MRTVAVAFLIMSGLLTAQPVREERFHGRQAWVLDNGVVRLSLLRGGGHIAEARFSSGDARRTVNPMRVPHYQTIEPYEYNPARHDALYGANSHRWLSSGYMGHLLCFPVFGPPSSEREIANELGNHGEAPIAEWTPMKTAGSPSGATVFRYGAALPKTQFRVERQVTLMRGSAAALVEEWAESETPFDRPVNWVQHATFGPPFIAPGTSFLDMSATKGQVSQGAAATNSLEPGSPVEWPQGRGRGGTEVSLRPFQPTANAGTYFAVLMDQSRPVSYFTMYNPEFRVLIGYLFRTSESPWLGDFQENQRMQDKPWDGKTVTRGIEFGTTPFAEGLRRSVDRGTMFGVPTYRWIGGKERVKTTYALFLAEIPDDFAGTADIALEDGAIVIRESGSTRTVSVPAPGLAAVIRP